MREIRYSRAGADRQWGDFRNFVVCVGVSRTKREGWQVCIIQSQEIKYIIQTSKQVTTIQYICIYIPVVISSRWESSPTVFLNFFFIASNIAKLMQGCARRNSDIELKQAVLLELSWKICKTYSTYKIIILHIKYF